MAKLKFWYGTVIVAMTMEWVGLECSGMVLWLKPRLW